MKKIRISSKHYSIISILLSLFLIMFKNSKIEYLASDNLNDNIVQYYHTIDFLYHVFLVIWVIFGLLWVIVITINKKSKKNNKEEI